MSRYLVAGNACETMTDAIVDETLDAIAEWFR
jgi:hypothetical protein